MNVNWVLGCCLLLGFMYGWRKGLLRIVSGIIGLILEFYIAFHFNGPLGEYIDRTIEFDERVTLFVSQHLPITQFAAAIPVEFLPKSFAQSLSKMMAAPGHAFSVLLLSALSFLILFFCTKLFFNILSRFLTGSLDYTIIGPLNRFLGGVLGAFFVALAIGLSLMGFAWVMGDRDLPGANIGSLTSLINQSDLAGFLLSLF